MIKLAIMAVGGQGGGVLTQWIVDLALSQGWSVQSTAVAGVAQRTGATIYYVEMAPIAARAPVFALAPAPGDVDVLIAAEWAEAGRAIQRGFVTPDRTLLIASTHRMHSVAEKLVPGDGRIEPGEIEAAVGVAARAVIAFDMQAPAQAAGSVVSATLFGALAASGALPFPRTAFEATIEAGGRGVEASLAAFKAGHDGPQSVEPLPASTADTPTITGPDTARAAWQALMGRVNALPEPARPMAEAGLRKVVDYQDPDYGTEYLTRVEALAALDRDRDAALTRAAAKYIANAMTYDDVIRVADLKTRRARGTRIAREMQTGDQAMHVTEFMHPRGPELISTLPAGWGRWIEARPRLAAWIDRRVNRGRRVRTDTVWGFGLLWWVAGWRRRRRGTLRHAGEMAHLEAWLALVHRHAGRDPVLAVEILACRRLIKGYSDTHARGLSKFDRVMGALAVLDGRDDAADWLRRLREAALKDEKGEALDGALKTVTSFAGKAVKGA